MASETSLRPRRKQATSSSSSSSSSSEKEAAAKGTAVRPVVRQPKRAGTRRVDSAAGGGRALGYRAGPVLLVVLLLLSLGWGFQNMGLRFLTSFDRLAPAWLSDWTPVAEDVRPADAASAAASDAKATLVEEIAADVAKAAKKAAKKAAAGSKKKTGGSKEVYGWKEVLVAGDGRSFPAAGDFVTVHYTGTLQATGAKFDSSVDRNEPFVTEIGANRLIRGWEIAVLAMSKGEKARLTITPDYAYGERAMGNAIPANSTLVFEMELLNIAKNE